MISLDLKNRSFAETDKWPLLYVIAEIFSEKASADNPLSDNSVVKIAQEAYGLNIERRTVAKYRGYLSKHFGFLFEEVKQGHYLSSAKAIINSSQAKNQKNDFFVFNYLKASSFLENKINWISKALKDEKQICISIANYIVFHTKRWKESATASGKQFQPAYVESKRFDLTPMKLFQFDRILYLLAFYPLERKHYIFKVNSLSLVSLNTPSSIRKAPFFDLDAYVAKQDYILTGPVCHSDQNVYDYGSPISRISYNNNYCTFSHYEPEDKPSNPFALQTLRDMFGPVVSFSSRETPLYVVLKYSFPVTGAEKSILSNVMRKIP